MDKEMISYVMSLTPAQIEKIPAGLRSPAFIEALAVRDRLEGKAGVPSLKSRASEMGRVVASLCDLIADTHLDPGLPCALFRLAMTAVAPEVDLAEAMSLTIGKDAERYAEACKRAAEQARANAGVPNVSED